MWVFPHSLRYRRVLFDLIFLFKILTGHAIRNIDSHFNFKAPYITRGHTFKLDFPDAITNSTRNKNLIIELWIIGTNCRAVLWIACQSTVFTNAYCDLCLITSLAMINLWLHVWHTLYISSIICSVYLYLQKLLCTLIRINLIRVAC